jgi:hypothetical protein
VMSGGADGCLQAEYCCLRFGLKSRRLQATRTSTKCGSLLCVSRLHSSCVCCAVCWDTCVMAAPFLLGKHIL